MRSVDANRQLLFGLLALQNGFISQQQLVAAFGAWTLDKSRPLDQFLVEQATIDAGTRELLAALVSRHLKLHGDDSERSLAALPAQDQVRHRLNAIADPDLQASLVRLPGGIPPRRDEVAATQAMPATPAGGRFVILRPHARGGLGKVSVALDSELNRNVALKEIRDEYANDVFSQSRFVQEAEITGQLEHPGIVPVYGLGSYHDGRPYYAMRFVEGDSLKAAIEAFHQSRRERGPLSGAQSVEFRNLLARFVGACHAIQYAHSRKVIHRDLKPENILLGPYGETLVVDWGLAKSLDRDQAVRSAAETLSPSSETVVRPVKLKEGSGATPTIEGAALGTPAFMSPEQAAGRVAELGPAADVYSLGATLYYLLTGQAAFRGDEISELLALVQRGDFPAPRSIWHAAPRPLEAICLKAMSIKPADRYASARALAEDIERFLADEPITACADPISVRARRWMKRHPALVTGAAATVILGLASAVTVAGLSQKHAAELTTKNTTISSQFAELQTRSKTIEEQNAALESSNQTISRQKSDLEKRNSDLELARKKEQQAKERSQYVTNYLVQMFRSANPGAGSKDIKVVDILDRQALSLMLSFDGDPLSRASLLHAIAESYDGLGEYAKAEPLHKMALRLRRENLHAEAPELIFSMNVLGRNLQSTGKFLEAVAVLEEGLEKSLKTRGARDENTLIAQANLAEVYRELGQFKKSGDLYQQVWDVRKVDTPDDENLAYAINGVALSYSELGRVKDAVPLFEQAHALLVAILGAEDPETLICHGNLADAYREAGETEKARAALQTVIDARTRILGENHPQTLYARNNLALTLQDERKFKEAETILHDVVERLASHLGKDHPQSLISKINLGKVCLDLRDVKNAVRHFDEAFEIAKADPGRLARQLVFAANTYGGMFFDADRFNDASRVFRSAVDALAKTQEAPKLLVLGLRGRLADSLRELGNSEEAIAIYEEVRKQRAELLGAEAPQTLFAGNNLALAYHHAQRVTEAVNLFEATVDGLTRRFGPEDGETITARVNRAEAYVDAGAFEKAISESKALRAVYETKFGAESGYVAHALEIETLALLLQSRFDEAAPLIERSQAIRTKVSQGHWTLLESQALLGWTLFRQGKVEAAAKPLVEGVDSLLKADFMPRKLWPRMPRMMEEVIALLEAQNKTEEAAKWKERLAGVRGKLSKTPQP